MADITSRWQQFPWREGNTFQLLIDGEEIFSAMLDSISSAQSQILLEMYLVESGIVADQFIAALVEAANRNVIVYLLFDDYGSRGFRQKDRRRLDKAGVHTVYYNPVGFWNPVIVWGWHRTMLRDHRKLLVVDDRFAFVGGMGITDDFDNAHNPKHYWHDVAVQAKGPVVNDWLAVFQHNWDKWTNNQFPVTAGPFPKHEDSMDESLPGQAGRVASGRFFGRSEIQRAFVKRVLGAEHHVWMMTAYFVPTYRLLHALRIAARRGVDVRLMAPGPATDHPSVRYAGRRHYHGLLRAGVRIYEYQPRFLHAKVLICDGWASLGSSNLDRWNVRWNLEANQEVEDSDFTLQVRELFEADIRESVECELPYWRTRSLYYRCVEWFWGRMERYVEGLSEWLQRHKPKP